MNRTDKKNTEVLTLPLIPLRDVVLFPGMIMPFLVGREHSLRALSVALSGDRKLFLATQHKADVLEPSMENIHSVGTLGKVIESLSCEDGTVKVLIEGLERGRILEAAGKEYLQAEVKLLSRQIQVDQEISRGMEELRGMLEQYSRLFPNLYWETLLPQKMEDPGRLADVVAFSLPLTLEERQDLLETISPEERLIRVMDLLRTEIDDQKVERKLGKRVQRQMEKAQREYYLSEKLKAIQRELGHPGENLLDDELQSYKKKIDALQLPDDVREKANHELRKLQVMPVISAESTVSKNYLDWILNIPWSENTEDSSDLKFAQRVLEEDHFGLDKIKERILEFLAARKLSSKKGGATILCFVGPPGVGKTSLSSSIARALGRKFIRLSLGGVRDEAEIRGHRRTYVGAFPGQIIQMMKRAGTVNPVFLLDEVDKMTMDFRGDPSSALLEVLDPEQNKSFLDHYLDVPYDLSKVFFIATANVTHNIPVPLYDRMEILPLPGYTEEEKAQIASRFLIPKELELHGLTGYKIHFRDSAVRKIIRCYTREAGVRSLQREIASICRKIAKRIALGDRFPKTIDPAFTRSFLGVEKFHALDREERDEVGMATGLAWTESGGELLFAEAALMKGRGRLMLTGKLGKVMQESAKAALSYIRSRTGELGIPVDFYRRLDFHVHVPEGAISKDGPSAGITMATALISALTQNPVKREVAMTGEITLRGKILPIGGVKEKVLAAHRAGMSVVILPRKNEKDLEEVPSNIKKDLKLKLVDSMDEVLSIALADSVNRREVSTRNTVRRRRTAAKEAVLPQ